MDLEADIMNSAGHCLPPHVHLIGPAYATTKFGLFITIQSLTPKVDKDENLLHRGEMLLVLVARPRISAGRLEFLELPMGELGQDGQIHHTTAVEEFRKMWLGAPNRRFNMSEMASSGRKLGEEMQLGVPSHGQLRGAIPNSHTYEQLQIELHEHKIPDEDFLSLKKRLRLGFLDKKDKADERAKNNSLRLVPFRNILWSGIQDPYVALAWALYIGLRESARLPMNIDKSWEARN